MARRVSGALLAAWVSALAAAECPVPADPGAQFPSAAQGTGLVPILAVLPLLQEVTAPGLSARLTVRNASVLLSTPDGNYVFEMCVVPRLTGATTGVATFVVVDTYAQVHFPGMPQDPGALVRRLRAPPEGTIMANVVCMYFAWGADNMTYTQLFANSPAVLPPLNESTPLSCGDTVATAYPPGLYPSTDFTPVTSVLSTWTPWQAQTAAAAAAASDASQSRIPPPGTGDACGGATRPVAIPSIYHGSTSLANTNNRLSSVGDAPRVACGDRPVSLVISAGGVAVEIPGQGPASDRVLHGCVVSVGLLPAGGPAWSEGGMNVTLGTYIAMHAYGRNAVMVARRFAPPEVVPPPPPAPACSNSTAPTNSSSGDGSGGGGGPCGGPIAAPTATPTPSNGPPASVAGGGVIIVTDLMNPFRLPPAAWAFNAARCAMTTATRDWCVNRESANALNALFSCTILDGFAFTEEGAAASATGTPSVSATAWALPSGPSTPSPSVDPTSLGSVVESTITSMSTSTRTRTPQAGGNGSAIDGAAAPSSPSSHAAGSSSGGGVLTTGEWVGVAVGGIALLILVLAAALLTVGSREMQGRRLGVWRGGGIVGVSGGSGGSGGSDYSAGEGCHGNNEGGSTGGSSDGSGGSVTLSMGDGDAGLGGDGLLFAGVSPLVQAGLEGGSGSVFLPRPQQQLQQQRGIRGGAAAQNASEWSGSGRGATATLHAPKPSPPRSVRAEMSSLTSRLMALGAGSRINSNSSSDSSTPRPVINGGATISSSPPSASSPTPLSQSPEGARGSSGAGGGSVYLQARASVNPLRHPQAAGIGAAGSGGSTSKTSSSSSVGGGVSSRVIHHPQPVSSLGQGSPLGRRARAAAGTAAGAVVQEWAAGVSVDEEGEVRTQQASSSSSSDNRAVLPRGSAPCVASGSSAHITAEPHNAIGAGAGTASTTWISAAELPQTVHTPSTSSGVASSAAATPSSRQVVTTPQGGGAARALQAFVAAAVAGAGGEIDAPLSAPMARAAAVVVSSASSCDPDPVHYAVAAGSGDGSTTTASFAGDADHPHLPRRGGEALFKASLVDGCAQVPEPDAQAKYAFERFTAAEEQAAADFERAAVAETVAAAAVEGAHLGEGGGGGAGQR